MKLCQSVVPYELDSQKRVTHSTIKVLHQPTSSECVTTFPCSLPRACPNDNEGKLQKFAMGQTASPAQLAGEQRRRLRGEELQATQDEVYTADKC